MVQVLPYIDNTVAIWGYNGQNSGSILLYNCTKDTVLYEQIPFAPYLGGYLGYIKNNIVCLTKLTKQFNDSSRLPIIISLGRDCQNTFNSDQMSSLINSFVLNGISEKSQGMTINVFFDLIKNIVQLKDEQLDPQSTWSIPLNEPIINLLKGKECRAQKIWCSNNKLIIFRMISTENSSQHCLILGFNKLENKWFSIVEKHAYSRVQLFDSLIFVQEIEEAETHNSVKPFAGKYNVYSIHGEILYEWLTTPETEILCENNGDIIFKRNDTIFSAIFNGKEIVHEHQIVQNNILINAHWGFINCEWPAQK